MARTTVVQAAPETEDGHELQLPGSTDTGEAPVLPEQAAPQDEEVSP
jgi:hypothetical protein